MPVKEKVIFSLPLGLKKGDSGDEVKKLQAFLQRFGYLQSSLSSVTRNLSLLNASLPDAAEGIFDDATKDALRNYQQFQGLPVTGELDEATVVETGKPRCGAQDRTQCTQSGDFTLQGNRWDHTNLTYRIVNFTSDLTEAEIRDAIRQAFNLWSEVTPLTFTEVTSNADILIRFATGDHGDGDPFDGAGNGAGNVLAHAYYPPPNRGDLAGDAHFDDAETWTVNASSGVDLVTVAAHEFGHSLGLEHSNVPGSLMFASYSGVHRFLSQDDIDGIQRIYGGWKRWFLIHPEVKFQPGATV
uniref:matrixin family metalloprotease n=1 Tax=Paenibacillus elgii TaxID=189691 RepID=UPI000248DAD8